MAIFLTGSTGYIGAHVAAGLLEGHRDHLNLLVRAQDEREAEVRLWRALQLHLDFPRFHQHLQSRITIFCGDLTGGRFGLKEQDYRRLLESTDSVIHCAASLNRKSEKACLNVNLRGTLEVSGEAAQAEEVAVGPEALDHADGCARDERGVAEGFASVRIRQVDLDDREPDRDQRVA